MNIAHTKIDAAAGAQFCGLAHVRRIAAACLIGVAALGSMSTATAGPDRDPRQRAAEQQRQPQVRNEDRNPRYVDERRDQRQFDQRAFEQRAEEQRRMMQAQQEQNAQNADAFRRSGRLTPDERRDLRRQINEAGADIYQNKPRR